MIMRELFRRICATEFISGLMRGLGCDMARRSAGSRSIAAGADFPYADPAGEDEFVRYGSILRTNDVSRLTILQLQLDRAGIRHYRSQGNMLHGGEVQLFVEIARLPEAEELLAAMDSDAD